MKGSKLTPGPGSTKVKSDDTKAPGNAENNTEERSRSRPVKKPIPTPRSVEASINIRDFHFFYFLFLIYLDPGVRHPPERIKRVQS